MNALLTIANPAAAPSRPVAAANAVRSGLRILLLTPYTGGNLGDGAIQEAVIYHLRQRLPSPKIWLVTLSPRATRALHRLPSFPIARTEIETAPVRDTAVLRGLVEYDSRPSPMGLVKKYLRQLPWLRNALAAAKRAGREVKSLLLSLPGEIRHLWRMRSLLVESDLLVMSGGGQIDDYWGGAAGHPYALFKWAMLARLCGTPVVFLSVGVCTVGTPLGRRLAHSALRLAAYRSYRDHGSKALLRAAAFTQSDPEFPDLAFSHPCAKRNPAAARIANASCAVVGISPIAFLRPQVWPESDPGVYEQYLQTLCNFTARVLAGGHPVVIFTTASMDRPAAKDLEARLRQRPESKSWNGRLRRIDQQRLERQLDEIGKMDLVVASRLHGVILSHLLSRPVLAISYDRKVRAHMESMTQERHCLNLRDCTVPQLCDGFDRIESDAVAIAANIRSRVEEFGQRLDRQYDRLVQTLLVK